MFFNYLKTALRNLHWEKTYSLINVAGLAVGIACCLLLGLYLADELSPWLFLGAGALALAVALLTVGYQAVRAALADPVEAIRYE